uniref:IncA protein n=1 Tax=Rhabditophanes sp. KR3021 TaxID=114890 RepID=A0AC35UE01_9BILA
MIISAKLLLLIFLTSGILFMIGIALSIINIESYGAGLYLSMVAVVVLLINATACVIGTASVGEDETAAKKMWGRLRTRISARRMDNALLRRVGDKNSCREDQSKLVNDGFRLDEALFNTIDTINIESNFGESTTYGESNFCESTFQSEYSGSNANNSEYCELSTCPEHVITVIWHENGDDGESIYL